MKLEGVDLAYISACQTSTGDKKLSEEAVHLAAGMLAAGYRGVIATMWDISDQHGPQVAKDFYAELISQDLELGQLSGLGTDDAARALHYSTQKLRKQLGDSSVDWIPYVHFGL
jgi:CHAT domain-containing protein